MSSSGGGTEEADKPTEAPNEEIVTEKSSAPDDSPGKDSSEAGPAGIETDTKAPPERPESPAPMAQPNAYPQFYAPHLTPQQGGGYYIYSQAQVTPEPPSPGYDTASFRQQHFMNNSFGQGYVAGVPPPPLSPRIGSSGSLPPPSPLFPRVTANTTGRLSPGSGAVVGGGPASPAPYLSPPLGPTSYGAMYQGYGGVYNTGGNGSGSNNASPEVTKTTWSERGSHNLYAQASTQLYGMGGIPRSGSSGSARTYSFDETSMLPPSVLDPSDHSNPAYSPYGGSQATPVAVGGTLFAQQTWGYGSSDMGYNAPPSPVPTRQSLGLMPAPFGGGGNAMRPSGTYGGQFFPATSPGPPIQTTPSNKGPAGANLFIFHIPNHFTNLDMYHLFCPYGNLLSVRIMVERETGRSRGFGFVSYDSPESAAMAIKELNGFAIGNKRLKVQHKQIRPGDTEPSHELGYGTAFQHSPPGSEFAMGVGGENPSESSHGGWYEEPKAAPQAAPIDEGEDNRYENNEEEEGVDLHRSGGLGNLDTLRNALPDIAGQSKG